jgi:flagellar motor switch protein FliM
MGSKILSKNFKDLDEGSVIEQIIRVAALSYDRLPVMEVTFERYALILAPALKVYTAGTADVVLESVDYLSCGEALESLDQLSFVMIANTSTNGEKIGVVLSTDLLFNNLEIMLGGGRFEPGPTDKRSFTMIEKRLGTRFCEIALNGLSEAIGQFSEMKFQIDSLESNPRNAMLAPLTTPCLKVVYRVKLGGRDGVMTFIVPNTALEKSPALTSQNFLAGRQNPEPGGTRAVASALREAEVSLTAVLRSLEIPLAGLLEMRPGDTIRLDIDPTEEAAVYCSNQSMFRAAIGQRKTSFLAAKVSSEVAPIPEDLMSRIQNQ